MYIYSEIFDNKRQSHIFRRGSIKTYPIQNGTPRLSIPLKDILTSALPLYMNTEVFTNTAKALNDHVLLKIIQVCWLQYFIDLG